MFDLTPVSDHPSTAAAPAARADEQGFRTLAENAADIIARFDLDLRHAYVNRAVELQVGVPREAFLGRTHAEFARDHGLPPEFAALWTAALERVRDSGAEETIGFQFPTPNGPAFYECRISPELAEDGTVSSMLAVGRDITRLKRADQALRDSERHFRAMFEQSPVGIALCRLDGAITQVNPAVERLLGRPAAALAGVPLTRLVHPDDRVLDTEIWQLVRGERDQFQTERRFVLPEGDVLWGQITLSLLRSDSGAPDSVIVRLVDVTDRKLAELAVVESEARFRQLTESTDVVYWLADLASGHAIYCTPTFERIWGIPVETLYADATAWRGSLHPDDRERVLAFVEENRTREYDTEYRIVRPDGQERWIRDRAFPVRDEAGNVHRTAGIAEDVTEQRAAEERLQRSEQMLAEAQRVAGLGSWSWDLTSGEVAWSENNFRMFGYAPGAVQPSYDLFLQHLHPADRVRVEGVHLAALAEGSDFECEQRVRTLQGEERVQLARGQVIRDENGSALRVVGTSQDITERKRADLALQRRDAVLEAVSFAAERFLRANHWRQEIDGVLARLGAAAEADRVYLFENHRLPDGTLCTSQRHEWVSDGTEPQIDAAELQSLPLREAGFGRWVDVLESGRPVHGCVGSFPAEEQELLRAQGIRSLAVTPIFVEGVWWGFIGLDACREQRVWATTELDALRAATSTLAAAIEQERALAIRQETEARFGTLFEQAADAICMHDLQGRFVEVNQRFCELTGHTREELLGTTVAALEQAVDAERLEQIWRGLRPGEAITADARIRRADGLEVPIQVRNGLIDFQGSTLVLAMIRDVTEQQRAADALRESETRYRALAELSPDAMVINVQGRFAYANAAAVRLLGLDDAEQLIGLPALDIVHPAFRDAVGARIQHVVESRTAVQPIDSVWIRRDGLPMEVEVAASPITWQGAPALQVAARDITERKRAESALRQSEERFRAIFDQAGVGIALMDLAGRPVQSNAALQRMLGYSAEQLASMPLEEFTHPADADADLSHFVELLEGARSSYRIEKRMVRSDGGIVWGLLTATLLRDGEGRPLHAIALVEDVTEKRRAEDALRQSEERFRSVVESLGEGVLLTDLEGRVVFANQRTTEILGYHPRELVGRPVAELVDVPGEVARIQKHLVRRRDGHSDHYEMQLPHREGHPLWIEVHAAPYRNASGQVIGVVSAFSDISERKRAEEALRESDRFNRSVMDSSTDCIKVLDLEGRLLSMNTPGKCLMEVDDFDAVCGADWPSFWPGELGEQAAEAVRSAAAGGVGRFRGFCPTAKGTPKWWDVVVTPIDGPAGTPERLLSISRDVTEQMQLEEQLRQAQKMEAVGRLAGGIAHDFNNLLTAIKGHTYLLRESTLGQPDVQEDLEVVAGAVDRASALTGQLLAFSRKQVLQPRVIRFNRIVSEMEKMLRRTIGEHIELVTDLDPALSAVRADPGQMEQVIMNLVVNGRDAMPNGGRLRVRTRNHSLAEGTFGLLAAGDYVRVEVSDTGVGMDDAVRARIFEPFFTTKGAGEGTGLGLATVYGIVQQSGGAIEVESAPGQGTTFTILLPRADDEELSPAPLPVAGQATPGGSEMVLVVEDDAMVRALVRSVLRSKGYRVLEAQSGADALLLREALGCPIDLLITDVVMPKVGGRELAEQLTTLQPSLRVLFMSGYTDDAVVHHGVREGGHFLPKPFAPDDLLYKVREVLDG